MQINTPEDWWKVCDDNWPDLLQFMELAGFPTGREECRENYVWGEEWLHLTEVEHPTKFRDVMERAKADRDWTTLIRNFNLAWFWAPDNRATRSWPGFFALCDLCSECWVHQPDEDEPE